MNVAGHSLILCTHRTQTTPEPIPIYAEVLESNQLVLVNAVQKLYAMVRNQQAWELGEPEFNEKGQPIIHDIVVRLGCSPKANIPEDEDDLKKLATEVNGGVQEGMDYFLTENSSLQATARQNEGGSDNCTDRLADEPSSTLSPLVLDTLQLEYINPADIILR
ncbi:hypothetical protein NPX13_g2100 [Xylaria arbuscula]|uniref:Uncharacterized protein n=1 Tax=Xylaria arbuscula TaxID=114810 RepID=A0A9W8NJT0_9PEZI|nr:hypothetical protein NPX13_g2100 [Xylaria arbuscula]